MACAGHRRRNRSQDHRPAQPIPGRVAVRCPSTAALVLDPFAKSSIEDSPRGWVHLNQRKSLWLPAPLEIIFLGYVTHAEPGCNPPVIFDTTQTWQCRVAYPPSECDLRANMISLDRPFDKVQDKCEAQGIARIPAITLSYNGYVRLLTERFVRSVGMSNSSDPL